VRKTLSKPFFSIVIPTYNRARDLKCAITAILQQSFHDFEIIVSDNNSKDKTQWVMSEFMDPRIRYFRNTRNLGWIPNLQRAINYSKGTYVLLHGDDDFMLHSVFLHRLHKKLQLEPTGFVRVNYLSYGDDQKIIFDFHSKQFTKPLISDRSDGDKIVEFIDSIDPFFITGNVIKGDILHSVPLIQSELAPWFPAVYKAIEKHGALLWYEYEFIATWSKTFECPRYYLSSGKYQFEHYFEEVKKHVSERYYKQFLDKRLNILIREFPSAKFFTSNANFVHYAIHLLDINPAFRFLPAYWFWVVFSLVIPRFMLHSIRKRLIAAKKDNSIPNLREIHRKIDLFNKLRDDKP